MPIYEFRCKTCERSQDVFLHIADRDAGPECCGAQTARQLSAPMVFVPRDVAYKCPVTDQVVTSERQRKNIMSEHRLVDANDFPPQQMIARKKAKTAANAALAKQLTADLPKEIVTEAAAIAAAA